MGLPASDKLGRTELHYAALNGELDAVAKLLAGGADANVKDKQGWTPLHFACQSSNAAAAQKLLEAGASVDPRDSHGNTPLFKAVFSSNGRGETIKVLRLAGADPHAANASGVTPVSLARTIANYDVRQFFADVPQM